MKRIYYIADASGLVLSNWQSEFEQNGQTYIEVADDVVIHSGCDHIVDGALVVDATAYQAQQTRIRTINALYTEINELKEHLADTDYQAVKHADGVLSDSEYEPIKTQRIQWRVRINELEEQLSSIE